MSNSRILLTRLKRAKATASADELEGSEFMAATVLRPGRPAKQTVVWDCGPAPRTAAPPGAIRPAKITYVSAFFASRAWWRRVPDTNHAVLTSGLGTQAATGSVNDSDYAAAVATGFFRLELQ